MKSDNAMAENAQQLLVAFVKHCVELYRSDQTVYNAQPVQHTLDTLTNA